MKYKKILSTGLAVGILSSSYVIMPGNKVQAAVDTSAGGTVFLATFGNIYNSFLQEPFGEWLASFDAYHGYNNGLENIAYKAPNFNSGSFAISVFDFYKNQDFNKTIKIGYPDGTIEYKTIKHGEQLVVKQAGVIVDIAPNSDTPQTFYITQSMLDSGELGISLTNWQTFFLTKKPNTSINSLLIYKFYPKENPGNFSFDKTALYNQLDPMRKAMATITTDTVSQTDFTNSIRFTTEELEDQANRMFEFNLAEQVE